MSKNLGKTIGKLASIAAIIATCIAAEALIPPFGQFLNPREPVQYITPNVVETSPTAYAPSTQPSSSKIDIEGKWSHTLLWIDGTYKAIVLKAYKSNDGYLKVDFIQQYWSYRPIFNSSKLDENEIEVDFIMVSYEDTSDISSYTLKYVFWKQQNDTLYATLLRSWERPVEIILVKVP